MSVLKDERVNRGLTQIEAAKQLDISYSMLGKLENGYRVASYEMMDKISKYYGKSVDYLFFNHKITDSDDKHPAK